MKKKSKILNNILKANRINKKSIKDYKITILGQGAGQNPFDDEPNNPECCSDVPIPPPVPDTAFFFPPYPTLPKETDTELERRARWYANYRDIVIENLFIPFDQSRISLFYFEIMCDGSFSSLWSESISYGLLGAYGNGINDIFHIGNSPTKAIQISKITKENVNYALMRNKSFNPSMFVGTIPMRKVSQVACAGGLLFEAIQYMIDNDFLGNASNLEQTIRDLSSKYFSNIEENKLFSFTGETESIINTLLSNFEDDPKDFIEDIKNNIDVYYNEKYVSFVRDYIILLSRATSDDGYIDSWNNIYGGDSDSDGYAVSKCKCELENNIDSDSDINIDSDSDSEFFIQPIDFFAVFPDVPVPEPGQPRPKPPRPPAIVSIDPEDLCKLIDDVHLAWDFEQSINQLEPLDAFINRVFPRPLGSSYGLKEANPYHVHFSVQNDVIYLCSLSHYHDATVRSYYLNICEATNIVLEYSSCDENLLSQLIDYENLNLYQVLPKNKLMEFYNDKNFRQYLIDNNLLLNYIVPCQGVINGDFRTEFRTASWVLGNDISSKDTIAVLDPNDEDINFDNTISINEDEPTYIGTSNGTIIGNMLSDSEALNPTNTDNLEGILLGLIFGTNVVPESPLSLSKTSSTQTICYDCTICDNCDSADSETVDSNDSEPVDSNDSEPAEGGCYASLVGSPTSLSLISFGTVESVNLLGENLNVFTTNLSWNSPTVILRFTADGDPNGPFFPNPPDAPLAALVGTQVLLGEFELAFANLVGAFNGNVAFSIDNNDLVITITKLGNQSGSVDLNIALGGGLFMTAVSIEAVCNPLTDSETVDSNDSTSECEIITFFSCGNSSTQCNEQDVIDSVNQQIAFIQDAIANSNVVSNLQSAGYSNVRVETTRSGTNANADEGCEGGFIYDENFSVNIVGECCGELDNDDVVDVDPEGVLNDALLNSSCSGFGGLFPRCGSSCQFGVGAGADAAVGTNNKEDADIALQAFLDYLTDKGFFQALSDAGYTNVRTEYQVITDDPETGIFVKGVYVNADCCGLVDTEAQLVWEDVDNLQPGDIPNISSAGIGFVYPCVPNPPPSGSPPP